MVNPEIHYVQGTRRLEEMMANARQLGYQENYSYTEGWDDNVVAEIFNLGLDRLYESVTLIDMPPNIEQVELDVFARQTEYDIPQDVHMALRIMDVRYLYGTQAWEYVTLMQGMIQDRFSYPTNIPDTYCIRNGKILLSPTPNITKQKSLIINYQKRMRKLDIRRGKVSGISSNNGSISSVTNTSPVQITTTAPHNLLTGNKVSIQNVLGEIEVNDRVYTITVTGANTFTLNGVDGTVFGAYTGGGFWFQAPIQFLLNFQVTSQKDINLQANANSVLDKVDYACFVDRNGNPVIDAIPLAGYNMTTNILTCDQNYVIADDNLTTFQNLLANNDTVYVVKDDYTSTHSQLDRQCEDQLIEYAVLRLLRLQSAAEPTIDQERAEKAVLDRLVAAYRRYRPSVMSIRWQETLRPRSWPFGPRGAYAWAALTIFALHQMCNGNAFL